MLLTGGYGHGSFRLLSVVPFDDWLRSSDPLGRCGDQRRQRVSRLPPYNIEKTGEDAYRLTMAVAGFSPAELDITVQENTLLVTGKAQKEDENGGAYLHRGIARRTFERRFSLADHMKVVGASLDNGLLYVDVVREAPGAAKPRTIKIGTAVETAQPQVTEQKAA
jgi:molecular chaperone IbpA